MKDVSQATLDVIESVKNKQTIKFYYQYKHGANDDPKTYTVTPSGFFGDFVGFEGTDEGKWDGIYQVRDTMNPKWTNRVDILTTDSRFKYNNITMYKYVDEYEVAVAENI